MPKKALILDIAGQDGDNLRAILSEEFFEAFGGERSVSSSAGHRGNHRAQNLGVASLISALLFRAITDIRGATGRGSRRVLRRGYFGVLELVHFSGGPDCPGRLSGGARCAFLRDPKLFKFSHDEQVEYRP